MYFCVLIKISEVREPLTSVTSSGVSICTFVHWKSTQFTCFTSIKVLIGTCELVWDVYHQFVLLC